MVNAVVVSGAFDDMRSRHIRLLHEASKRGPVHVHLWSDAAVREAAGAEPRFPQPEREYLVSAIRYVDRVTVTDRPEPDATGIGDAALAGFELPDLPAAPASRKTVVVTGCYDWFHSGHVAFFEEVSRIGELTVVVGHDATITLLKGPGHPMFPQAERAYMVAAIRFVSRVLISSGMGWLDAAPEIERIKPEIYAVNEDGDRPEKREFCATRGIEYRVLKRVPHAGLPRRESTRLRGF
ncbi:MAG: adenylyltransferase/cytidyltransferase family protein [Candidatus Coatesbacteria bacterium]